jgi:hypothetical protein
MDIQECVSGLEARGVKSEAVRRPQRKQIPSYQKTHCTNRAAVLGVNAEEAMPKVYEIGELHDSARVLELTAILGRNTPFI